MTFVFWWWIGKQCWPDIDPLCLRCSVGVVNGMPRAGSHYNLGTSRGPDKIVLRAGPGPTGRVLHVVALDGSIVNYICYLAAHISVYGRVMIVPLVSIVVLTHIFAFHVFLHLVSWQNHQKRFLSQLSSKRKSECVRSNATNQPQRVWNKYCVVKVIGHCPGCRCE